MKLSKSGNSYTIHEVYKINENSDNVEIHEYGKWSHQEGMSVVNTYIWKRRFDLKGHHLR